MEVKDEHLAKLLLCYGGTTLVCTDGEHYKFWNVTAVDGEDGKVITTWGRIGHKTQSREKYMNRYQLEKTIQSKIDKGYERV